MRYAVVYEKSETGYGAYVPDLPGCVAAGETLEETNRLIKEAVEFHLEGMREDGLAAPRPECRRRLRRCGRLIGNLLFARILHNPLRLNRRCLLQERFALQSRG